mmetsp:Transcript_14400/g.56645  ORF Transcript_14400/g.56645 Transcript_14400/m.56645 type:complete len:196 (-) Transcript_14400:191-778(-)|eukprot:CAMPEP_0114612380 /NCGR_PEP_ID=MMETSP0168-20121206/4592_1 /TAXON_ID=95228 ORGANISM="Vannella sp., Strain DIVA3 517/6/12" /NCGR_SAMPLE_ID=MMETSP0168 /ASSEMBLY_ACC=CAM_ASM_000044 /LENGTH=195 /DNA_ID=CAMNT_0001823363 /DNA_START=28 /DNA_END=615 /DNA_ORIENTATION=-
MSLAQLGRLARPAARSYRYAYPAVTQVYTRSYVKNLSKLSQAEFDKEWSKYVKDLGVMQRLAEGEIEASKLPMIQEVQKLLATGCNSLDEATVKKNFPNLAKTFKVPTKEAVREAFVANFGGIPLPAEAPAEVDPSQNWEALKVKFQEAFQDSIEETEEKFSQGQEEVGFDDPLDIQLDALEKEIAPAEVAEGLK